MSQERWGIFALNDHLRRHPFFIDVLLYDRLIIPYPPHDERQRWTARGWQPDRLEAILGILDELAIPVIWDESTRDRFKNLYVAAEGANLDVSNMADYQHSNLNPFYLTRMLLDAEFLPHLPKGVSRVWVIAAYPSASAYRRDYTPAARQVRNETLGLVLSSRFLAPRISGKSDRDLLRQAVRLASRDDFREKRAQLYKWQEDIIENDISDNEAIEEMGHHLEQYNDVVRRAKREVCWKFAFTVIPIGLRIGATPLATPLMATGALVSLARFVKFVRKPVIQAGECAASAMFYDIHRSFRMENG
ncbi:MAG TPA: hypothetical protein VGA72_04360 [Anaerolineales bacterium]